MQLSELDFIYPEELVATQPSAEFRTLLSNAGEVSEIDKKGVLDLFNAGDVLVINDTEVLKRRVFSSCGLEILFLKSLENLCWEVLFPAKNVKVGQSVELPSGLQMTLVKKGLPQTVRLSDAVTEAYFDEVGELALPPYIQKARSARHTVEEDSQWYQTQWAKNKGSFAAPTASLHFAKSDLETLKLKGVHVVPITLHVGLGTFLPIKSQSLDEHVMHSEHCFISAEAIKKIQFAKTTDKRIFALGTTVTRALESYSHGLLLKNSDGSVSGETSIFIQPGFKYTCVDVLMTNFHQPKSTLIALVAAFAGLEHVKKCYAWAMEKRFKLFSYGDFSIWIKDNHK